MLRTARYRYTIYNKGDYREQLFDMEKDPGEMANLAVAPDCQSILKLHRQYMGVWVAQTQDGFPYINVQ